MVEHRRIYTPGGTVQAGQGVYLERQADAQLLQLCREGDFAYVLTSRQMGKSSLMVHTARQLATKGIVPIIVDLTDVGVQNVTAESWYRGVLLEIENKLEQQGQFLETDVYEWWERHRQLTSTQRFAWFFRTVLLQEINVPIVVFIDEIDTTLSLDFTDDFFIAIRSFYTARAQVPAFQRLSFVLIGVATPGDLIIDARRTPFNIGQRVDLTDFTLDEAWPLRVGLGLPDPEAQQVLQWALRWTGGHPYLTQRLCIELARVDGQGWTRKAVDTVVHRTFLGARSEQDNNLQFVRDMLTTRSPDVLGVLATYKTIYRGKPPVRDEEQSLIKAHLKLSGVVKPQDGVFRVRNRIYHEVFNLRWVRDHWPLGWWERVKPALPLVATSLAIAVVMTIISGFALEQTTKLQNALEERDEAVNTAQEKEQEARAQAELAAEKEQEARAQAELAEKRLKDAQLAQKKAEAAQEAEAEAEAEVKKANQELVKKNEQLTVALEDKEKALALAEKKEKEAIQQAKLAQDRLEEVQDAKTRTKMVELAGNEALFRSYADSESALIKFSIRSRLVYDELSGIDEVFPIEYLISHARHLNQERSSDPTNILLAIEAYQHVDDFKDKSKQHLNTRASHREQAIDRWFESSQSLLDSNSRSKNRLEDFLELEVMSLKQELYDLLTNALISNDEDNSLTIGNVSLSNPQINNIKQKSHSSEIYSISSKENIDADKIWIDIDKDWKVRVEDFKIFHKVMLENEYGTISAIFSLANSFVTDISIREDGKYLAIANGNIVQIWDSEMWNKPPLPYWEKPTEMVRIPFSETPKNISFSSDGKHIDALFDNDRVERRYIFIEDLIKSSCKELKDLEGNTTKGYDETLKPYIGEGKRPLYTNACTALSSSPQSTWRQKLHAFWNGLVGSG